MRFPQTVALAALTVYALTISRGITLNSLPLTSKIAGWDWLPMANHPLMWLLTLPLRLLPAAFIPLSLNFFTAIVGGLTLGLLARSVELLPWNRPPDKKKIRAGRLPALLACVVCGFEYSYWREATAATGEMVDLFLLAAAIWCLLEYRAVRKMHWLNAAVIIWGIGMSENWVMLLTLPLFMAAVVALRKEKFFQFAFLFRMTLLGLAGFSLYALLPLANWLNPHTPWNFHESWLMTLRSTMSVFYTLWPYHRLLSVSVLLYFLVPTIPCFIRLKNETPPNPSKVDRLQIWIYKVLRVALLVACLWLVFDPEVGPREIMRQQVGVSMSLLSFDYLNALGIAFLGGNLMYAAQVQSLRRSRDAFQKFNSWLRSNTAVLLTTVTMLVAAGLLARSLPAILLTNRQPLKSFGELVFRSLPAGGGIVLGDDTEKLETLRATFAGHPENQRWLVADVRLLPSLKYRASLERNTPGWLATPNDLEPDALLRQFDRISRTTRIFYVQPKAGHFLLEQFQPQPLAAVHELKPYAENTFTVPPLTPGQIGEGEIFWDNAWQNQLQSISRQCSEPPPAWTRVFSRRLAIARAEPDQSGLLGQWFSVALNDWGVELQRNGKFSSAHRRFEQALALNTNNWAATLNLQSCSNLLAGKTMSITDTDPVMEKFSDLPQLARVIKAYGTMDHPVICYVLGNACIAAGWPRQALQQFERARELAPEATMPQFAMAQIYSRYRMDEQVFETVGQLRKLETNSPGGDALELELSILESKSWMSRTNPAKANQILESILQQHSGELTVSELVLKTYLAFGEATNALQLLNAQIAKDSDNIAAINNKAAILIQLNKNAEAVSFLDRALAITNLPSIRLNRAIAYMQMLNYPEAEKDYLQLENTSANQFSVEYGLARIAELRHDTNVAVFRLGLCLSNTTPESANWKEVRIKLNALRNSAQH
jgi:tetratricopeptide (TPR) repeat protein